MRSFSLATVLMVCAGRSSADTVSGLMRDGNGAPIAGQPVRLTLNSTGATIATGVSDATGNFSIDDPNFSGQNRCLVASRPGWNVYYGGTALNAPVCATSFSGFVIEFRLLLASDAEVFGGPNGYVDLGRGESATIVVYHEQTMDVMLEVYNARGRRVLKRSHRLVPVTGTRTFQSKITWDGRDEGGGLVPSGVYLAHVSGHGLTKGVNKKLKIAVVRR